MEKIAITLEGLVAVIASNYIDEPLKKKAINTLEYALETAMPAGLKKAQNREIHLNEIAQ